MTDPKHDGGPVYPTEQTARDSDGLVKRRFLGGGMTMLAWYAAQASERDIELNMPTVVKQPSVLALRCEARFIFADAMIAEERRRESAAEPDKPS